jgi:dolichol-phosphate mannosyltransferase
VHTRSDLIVVLPAYNEADNLEPLIYCLSEVLAGQAYEIVVVDDGSRDGSAEILERLSSSNPIHVVAHPANQGLGQTILDGLRYACDRATPNSVIITMDADQTHPAAIIPQLVREIGAGYDMAIASRYRSGSEVFGLSLFRRILSYGASVLFQVLLPTRGVRDYTCGYRAYRTSSLCAALKHYGDDLVGGSGFECMAGILVRFRALGLRFAEVPFILRYDRKLGESKMRIERTIFSTLKLAAAARRAGYSSNVLRPLNTAAGRDA